jgi:dihydropyrimidinase
MNDVVIRGGTIVTPYEVVKADVAVSGGKIATMGVNLSGRKEIDASGKLVFPGVIDAHTHMAAENYGISSSDDFLSGTIAAACGGVTTIIDFTVGDSKTSIPEEIEARKREAAPSVVDFALHAEVIGWEPGHEEEFERAQEAGVKTFKFYMAYGSLGQRSDSAVLYRAFRKISEFGGVAMVHAEDDSIIESFLRQLTPAQKGSMAHYSRTRPPICEALAVAEAVTLTEDTRARLHIVHVSSRQGLEIIHRAHTHGVRVSGETCPQYLLLTEDVYKKPEGHLFSVMPPLRTERDQDALWKALREGTLDLVATDHCPFTVEQKTWKGSFLDLPYGLPGVETLLSLLYSEGVAKERLALTDLPRLLCEGPARVNGLYPRKGTLRIGSDADIVIFDPDKEWTIHAKDLHMNTDFSPYEEMAVHGAVDTTISRGRVVYTDGEFQGNAGWGEFVAA